MRKILFLPLACFAMPLAAEPIRVAVDIAPIHSLVARVMQGVGEPDLIVAPDASPHTYALRPSQAAALERAQLVFWTSAELTPWLQNPLETLASNAVISELMLIDGTVHHAFREGHEAHEGHKEHDADEEDSHDKDEHGHGGGHDEEHEQAHDKEHGHDHSDAAFDPHGWLDPQNAVLWVQAIANALSSADQENAAIYAANAQAAQVELTALSANITAQMEPFQASSYMVLHDAFQYFDRRFGPAFAGAIALGDAAAPSPARISGARHALEESGATCLFKEPQQSARLVEVVLEGSDANLGELDAIGARLSPGPYLYTQLLQGLADSYSGCLAD